MSISIVIHENISYIYPAEIKKYRAEMRRYEEKNVIKKLISRMPNSPKPIFIDNKFGISYDNKFVPLVVGENNIIINCAYGTQVFIENSSSKQPLFTVSDQMVRKFVMDGSFIG